MTRASQNDPVYLVIHLHYSGYGEVAAAVLAADFLVARDDFMRSVLKANAVFH
jgi:hypothetical protein